MTAAWLYLLEILVSPTVDGLLCLSVRIFSSFFVDIQWYTITVSAIAAMIINDLLR